MSADFHLDKHLVEYNKVRRHGCWRGPPSHLDVIGNECIVHATLNSSMHMGTHGGVQLGVISLVFDWWDQATWGTRIFTSFRGEFVGQDSFGNRYFQEKRRTRKVRVHWDRRRRWVIYKAIAEASTVPPEWNSWLQHTVDSPPSGEMSRYEWEKEHLPNLTGTATAYRPPGSALAEGQRDRATGDYEPWRPS